MTIEFYRYGNYPKDPYEKPEIFAENNKIDDICIPNDKTLCSLLSATVLKFNLTYGDFGYIDYEKTSVEKRKEFPYKDGMDLLVESILDYLVHVIREKKHCVDTNGNGISKFRDDLFSRTIIQHENAHYEMYSQFVYLEQTNYITPFFINWKMWVDSGF